MSLLSTAKALRRLFDLRNDQDEPAAIDEAVRAGVRIAGTNLWVLMFAMLIASVGLNVNAPAVIIGAMLISPLMGPIVGIGYGAGINDFTLIGQAFRNLGIFALLSVVTSTLYFGLSPLEQAQSELLARTTPTIWDVMIAFFGGCAGIVALTRKEISNVVPGVAIATALMPPLCTAGFALANGHLQYFGGALFLFAINSVFIALATLLFVKLLRLPQRQRLDASVALRTRALIAGTVLVIVLPSGYFGYQLVRKELYAQAAQQVISDINEDPHYLLIHSQVDLARQELSLTLAGETPPANLAETLVARFARLGFPAARVRVRSAAQNQLDVTALKAELTEDLYRNTVQQLATVSEEKAALERQLAEGHSDRATLAQVLKETRAQLPEASQISVTSGLGDRADSEAGPILQVLVETPASLPPAEQQRLQRWLTARLPDREVRLVWLASERPAS